MKIKTCFVLFSKKLQGHFNQILCVSFQVQGYEIFVHVAGHMTKMASLPIYGKTHKKKIFFSKTGGLFSTKLGM